MQGAGTPRRRDQPQGEAYTHGIEMEWERRWGSGDDQPQSISEDKKEKTQLGPEPSLATLQETEPKQEGNPQGRLTAHEGMGISPMGGQTHPPAPPSSWTNPVEGAEEEGRAGAEKEMRVQRQPEKVMTSVRGHTRPGSHRGFPPGTCADDLR